MLSARVGVRITVRIRLRARVGVSVRVRVRVKVSASPSVEVGLLGMDETVQPTFKRFNVVDVPCGLGYE